MLPSASVSKDATGAIVMYTIINTIRLFSPLVVKIPRN